MFQTAQLRLPEGGRRRAVRAHKQKKYLVRDGGIAKVGLEHLGRGGFQQELRR